MKVNLSKVLDIYIDDLADALFEQNDRKTILMLIKTIDNRFACMDFSEKLFTDLANSIALEGVDACDMEGIVKQAREGFKC